jgi:glycosyltransferase involved in cell wall biosynthesis
MKLLMIGLDKSALNLNSPTAQRLLGYSTLVDKLDIIILGIGGEARHKNNLSVFPTSKNKIKSLLLAYKIGEKILLSSDDYLISTQDPFFTGLIGYLLKKKLKKLLQIQIHTDIFSPFFKKESFFHRVRLMMACWLIPRADCLRVVSSRIKDSLLKNFKSLRPEKIAVLSIFVDTEKIKQHIPKINLHKKYSNYDFIILIASRFTKEKNIELAIDAMREIIKEYPKTLLLIVGAGPRKNNYEKRSENYELKNNIIFEPWTEDIISYYKTSDLFILTSYYEGWGRTVVEAMAAKCPVIMTNVGLANELLISGYNGIVIPVDDKKALIESILSIIETPGLKEKITANAFLTVNSLETKEQYLEKYLKSWQNC